jgi:hypothetical protein
MFYCIATKSLNDGTRGFRYNVLGVKGIVRKRQTKSRGFNIEKGKAMRVLNMGKLSVYFERKKNTYSVRKLRHWAG